MDPIIEQWKQIPAPFGLFEASTLGRVRRLCDGFVMSHGKGADGYCRIPLRLTTGGKRTCYVHRLIAMTWCVGDFTQTVNHIDMRKDNNCATNLQWVTFSENHRLAHALQPRMARIGAKIAKAVVATDAIGVETRYPSGKIAALAIGGANRAGNISHAIATGRVAYGQTWRLAD